MEKQNKQRKAGMKNQGILIDSSVIIEILTGNQIFSEKLSGMMQVKRVYVSPLSISEIFSMIDDEEKMLISRLFDRMNILTIDCELSIKAGDLLRNKSARESNDLTFAFLAASALHFELKIWTVNKEKYPFINDDFFSSF
ncbi:MAG: PIN domain-containing protein [Ignavibacteriaceae bacterium]|nr:PIN domain-containing protein [Ignavibacteriaceae bacterium]